MAAGRWAMEEDASKAHVIREHFLLLVGKCLHFVQVEEPVKHLLLGRIHTFAGVVVVVIIRVVIAVARSPAGGRRLSFQGCTDLPIVVFVVHAIIVSALVAPCHVGHDPFHAFANAPPTLVLLPPSTRLPLSLPLLPPPRASPRLCPCCQGCCLCPCPCPNYCFHCPCGGCERYPPCPAPHCNARHSSSSSPLGAARAH